ncbi:MAG: WG repeat-containing protein [Sedimentibacter sp.]|uniref:WG repeat-containing protein n=1 Tax=Sedimentibacter sp. TaxID=1960295 RepID=UPI00315955CF
MQKSYGIKFIVLFLICVFLFSTNTLAFGMDFNDDIQKITLDYYYYDGFGQDKVVQSVNDGSWHILKPDGSLINLKGKYLAFAGMEGKNQIFDDNYYRFVIGNDSYSIDYSNRFIYVDKNGLECFVDGYKYVDPTKGENYFILSNVKGNGYETGLYHKCNKTLIIPAVYDTLNYISDDRIIACKNDKYGMMNIEKEEIIPFSYKYIDYINDNFIIAINDDDKYGVINLDNEVVLSFEYDEIYNIHEYGGYLRISINNKFGLINTATAEIVVPLEYEGIEYSRNETAVAIMEGRYGVIDVTNKIVVPFIYDSIMNCYDGFIVYKDEMAGFVNEEGNVILPVECYNISEVKDGYVTAVIEDKSGEHKYAVYDLNGEEIVPPIYDYIDYYATDKYMLVNKGWYAYLINKETGKEMIADSNLHFTDVKYINDKYYAGGLSGGYAVVNFAGQRLTLHNYNDISIINIDGEDIIAAKYHTERFNTYFDYFKQTNGPSTWAKDEVTKAIESNLVPFEYQAAFTFNIKRYEFCSIIVEFLEEYQDTSREEILKNNNIDLVNPPITDGFSEDIAICLDLGIVNGRGNGIFDGESEITREEAAVMLTNLSKYLGLYKDSDDVYLNDKSSVSPWAMDAVNFVLQNNMMQGVGNDIFSPKTNITREQTYIIMYRMLNDIDF